MHFHTPKDDCKGNNAVCTFTSGPQFFHSCLLLVRTFPTPTIPSSPRSVVGDFTTHNIFSPGPCRRPRWEIWNIVKTQFRDQSTDIQYSKCQNLKGKSKRHKSGHTPRRLVFLRNSPIQVLARIGPA